MAPEEITVVHLQHNRLQLLETELRLRHGEGARRRPDGEQPQEGRVTPKERGLSANVKDVVEAAVLGMMAERQRARERGDAPTDEDIVVQVDVRNPTNMLVRLRCSAQASSVG